MHKNFYRSIARYFGVLTALLDFDGLVKLSRCNRREVLNNYYGLRCYISEVILSHDPTLVSKLMRHGFYTQYAMCQYVLLLYHRYLKNSFKHRLQDHYSRPNCTSPFCEEKGFFSQTPYIYSK